MYDLIFDPGHGGRDPGAVGPTRYEKDLSLTLAKQTATILVESGKYNVRFTRDIDKDFCGYYFNVETDLINRVDIANEMRGSVFVSFHINSANREAHGNEVYAWQPGSRAEKLAKAINARMAAQLDMVDRGVKFANWYVCRKTHMPACLVEYGFIKSEEDVIIAKMDQAALSVAQGIADYFGVILTLEAEEEDVLENAILMFSDEDYWSAKDVSAKDGGIAIFVRQGKDKTIPIDAMKAKQLITIGGPETGHTNEILLSGKDKYKTADAVRNYLNR